MSRPDSLGMIRFGLGMRPGWAVVDGAALLADLDRDDRAKITPFATRLARAAERAALRRAQREGRRENAQDALNTINRHEARDSLSDLRAQIAQLVAAPIGFQERVTAFWANHFAADTRRGYFRFARASYIAEAIQPHIAGNFATLLRAAVTHPVMQGFLNQNVSVGPFSRVGRRTGRGLNENLARELLELHTLGAGYTQADVTQMARLLTGVTFDLDNGYKFDPRIAEPGLIEIFGKRYGGRPVMERHVFDALDDLALRPETAAHLAGKLARHFVSDDPDPQLVAHMQAVYLASGGNLRALYRAMLEHPAAWAPELRKTRAPMLWVAASLRATGVTADQIRALSDRDTRRDLLGPLRAMGERWEAVPSPAGYDDSARGWITAQAMAARITWAMGLADRLPHAPDPRDFVTSAMGGMASRQLARAAAGAETRGQGVGIILSAPEFNRC
ncbi:MAG: protein of unknown function DUF1800 [Roseibaca calidilacus]|uniref:Uncharacterized conserved protein, DUF1800 family n=1 Tax=Roseibaca calidilacus TaxID=1666912 RepID=A0A0P7VXI7_9RHOB|nr:DUF1800 domain-containing protein [Roseibaca calidilacus]KPP91938.1 MAG: protein of unknown function DUF1800 [Roseibaca calidilacus]CUX82260.1 Uncharacterized conserved protein, DUF1800 family [Roseibaca calidilacus]